MQCTRSTLLSAGRQSRRHALSNAYRSSRPRVLALGLVIEGTCPDESFQPINGHSTHQSEWRDQTDLSQSIPAVQGPLSHSVVIQVLGAPMAAVSRLQYVRLYPGSTAIPTRHR